MSRQVSDADVTVRRPDLSGGASASAEPTTRKILAATSLALIVAGVILVTAVLPAEFGIDPLGTGRLLGLTALSGGAAGAIAPQPAEYKLDSNEFVLGPYEFMEYKYRIEQGGSMVFSWAATGPLMYDFHSEPDGAPQGYAESFDKQQSAQANGTYTAPFSGIHGWFWENPGSKTVTITLTTAGFYSAAQEFSGNDSSFHPLTDIRRP
jgi:hypothetical protein